MIEANIVETLFKVSLTKPEEKTVPSPGMEFSHPSSSAPEASSARPLDKRPLDKRKKIGRNDPCPCGSGKKYKKCCWPKYG